MQSISLRRIRAVIAVCEEGSFTRAAQRENATQSGMSNHVASIERELGSRLFERSKAGVIPTPAGLRYYRHCVEAVGMLQAAEEEMRGLAGSIRGKLRVGLISIFTRAVLAPTLNYFVPRFPDVTLHVHEDYSARLAEMVMADRLDFAIVPAFEGKIGLKSRVLVRAREVLLSSSMRGLHPLAPVRLADCGPLRVVMPGHDNYRCRNLATYFATNGVEITRLLEMDGPIGTLEFVAQSDWVTVLPCVISRNITGTNNLVVSPIIAPPLHSEFVVIHPTRRALSTQARLFLERFEIEVARIQAIWNRAFAPRKIVLGRGARASNRGRSKRGAAKR